MAGDRDFGDRVGIPLRTPSDRIESAPPNPEGNHHVHDRP